MRCDIFIIMKFAVLIAAFLLCLSFTLCAEGQEDPSRAQPVLSLSQKKIGEKNIDIFIVVPSGEKTNTEFLENFHLSSQTSAFFWSSFKMRGKTIVYDSDSQYSTTSKKQLEPATGKGYTIYRYSLRIRGEEPVEMTKEKAYSVTCTVAELLASNQQPVPCILEKAVRASRKKEGTIRLQSLSYASGTFSALVEIR